MYKPIFRLFIYNSIYYLIFYYDLGSTKLWEQNLVSNFHIIRNKFSFLKKQTMCHVQTKYYLICLALLHIWTR